MGISPFFSPVAPCHLETKAKLHLVSRLPVPVTSRTDMCNQSGMVYIFIPLLLGVSISIAILNIIADHTTCGVGTLF